MPDFGIYAGDTNKTIYVRLRDSTTGLAKTGLVFNSAGAVCSYTLPLAARAAITLATQTVTGAHSDGGFVEIDATNCKGLYRLDLPDAAIASGDFTVISIEFDGIIEESVEIPLHTRNVNVTQWLGTAAATPTTAGVPEVDVTYIGGDAQSMTDLKDFADAGYDPATNKVQGVVLADTVTTLTGHTAQTGDNYARLGAPAGASVSADIATVDANVDTLLTRITSTLFTGITSLAEWLGLMAGKQVADATALAEIKATGAGSGTYDEAADSLEAIRDRGDAAWTTGGGASLTDILNVHAVIPISIDLANTATVRLGLMLTNALDDLPSTTEITPGTIDIDRKAIGGTSWTSVVAAAACSEQAGMVYYDEVFDSGTGYAEGDSIRVTFKSQKITVSANDYEITDTNGVIFQTYIRETMRGTDSAATATALATAQTDLDTITGSDGVTLATTQGNYAPSKAGDSMALTAAAVDAVWDELTAGHVTASTFGKAIADILADTNELQTDDIPGTLGTPAGADLATDIAANQTDLNTIITNIAALNDISVADITGATVTELSSVPAASPSLIQALGLLYMALRNKLDVTASAKEIHNDAGTVLGTKSLSDDGTTYSEAKMA